LTLSATTRFNEFRGQMKRSLFDRHLTYHEPASSLNIQCRMHPLLSKFPNNHTYGGRLSNSITCKSIEGDKIFTERLIEWAKPYFSSHYTPTAEFARLLGVKVLSADVEIDQATFSRSNPKVAELVGSLFKFLFLPNIHYHDHYLIQRTEGVVS
jgi:AAA domain